MTDTQNKENAGSPNSFVGGGLAIFTFLIFFFGLNLPIISSAILGTVFFFIGFQISSNKTLINKAKSLNIKPNYKLSALKTAELKLRKIEEMAINIEEPDIKSKINSLCNTGNKIIDNIRNQPETLQAARQFFNYYLDATTSIIEKYKSLHKNSLYLSSATDSLIKTKDLLDVLDVAYRKQLEKLYDKDILELDIELQVLAKTLKMEGIK